MYTKDLLFKSDGITEEGIFSGYASTFGGKPDAYGDIIKYGAFADTIRKGGRHRAGIPMLLQHNAERPIGKWLELKENSRGLQVTGQLAIQTSDGNDAYVFMKMGVINAMSIGWEILKEDSEGLPVSEEDAVEYDEKNKIRILKKIDLWEISVVLFPANHRARITDVKEAIESAKTVRELEHALKEAGLSNSSAKYIVSLCKDKLKLNDESENKLKFLLNQLQNTRKEILVSSLVLKSLREANLELKKIETKPTPRDDESEDDFIKRCIPIVLEEGTAQSQEQAVAICYSIWKRRNQ